MSELLWIIIFGLLMACIALVGGITMILREEVFQVAILPLVAFAAGSLIGGATFHMIPAAVNKMGNTTELYVWLNAGFTLFYGIEEFLHWHHSHTHSHAVHLFAPPHDHQHPIEPLNLHSCEESCAELGGIAPTSKFPPASSTMENIIYTCSESQQNSADIGIAPVDHTEASSAFTLNWLILIADGLHNFLGGMFVGASFINSKQLGISAWLAAAAHEIPQELGDFAILVHGGWSKKKAMLFNFISALTFSFGGIVAYATSKVIDVSFLIPFAAGNFLYIGASDLIPEIKHHHGAARNIIHFTSFTAGLVVLLAIRIALDGW